MDAISPIVRVSNPKKNTMPNTNRMAAKDAGITLVNLGSPQITTMVKSTKPKKIYKVLPLNHSPSTVWNWLICDIKMITAKPFTNPNITGCGTKRINFPSRSTPASICMIPARITVANTYSTPYCWAKLTITTATAPVAPEIIPGLPPKIEVTNPITNAAYNPVRGDKPAIKAKAMASGTKASATVRPDKTSVR